LSSARTIGAHWRIDEWGDRLVVAVRPHASRKDTLGMLGVTLFSAALTGVFCGVLVWLVLPKFRSDSWVDWIIAGGGLFTTAIGLLFSLWFTLSAMVGAAWRLAGRETIEIDSQRLLHRVMILGLGLARRYDFGGVSKIRAEAPPQKRKFRRRGDTWLDAGDGYLAFEYRSRAEPTRICRVGDREIAREILETMAAKSPQISERLGRVRNAPSTPKARPHGSSMKESMS
jgi:hypothetical protein